MNKIALDFSAILAAAIPVRRKATATCSHATLVCTGAANTPAAFNRFDVQNLTSRLGLMAAQVGFTAKELLQGRFNLAALAADDYRFELDQAHRAADRLLEEHRRPEDG